ncbi:MAG: DUF3011 domain-containing protein [Thermoanaerobaculales bacterium]|nr:DUF3011 domain-containing protein [Thermoanaerobaculales bacterium]
MPGFTLALMLLATVGAQAVAFGAEQARVPATDVVCGSQPGERQVCAADTSGGVTLLRSVGPGACELGRTWGWDAAGIWVAEGCGGEFGLGPTAPASFGSYTPGRGFKLADTEHGDLNFRLFTYVRYLNQMRLDESFTDSFGVTKEVQLRQDFQLNKAQVNFFGWFLSRKLRYLAYVWTSNASLGQATQVVVGGNLSYSFNEHLTVGAGISSLPGVRSTEGNFPYWLGLDARLIGDEFFRPSYTTGIWARGSIFEGLDYNLMVGNNLSQFGIDAGQLSNTLDTVSAALVWMPTTGEFGATGGFGDFEGHEEAATRIGLHATSSDEDRQSQPDTEGYDNVQLRLSDGNIIFAADLFGPGIQIDEATYQMVSVDAGLKYRGFSVEGEFYWRVLDRFVGPGVEGLPFDALNDHGFQLQASMMLKPETLQLYAGGSKIFGEYGDPWDARLGLNWFPWRLQVVRWNVEVLELDRSPVGALSLPYPVGGTGTVFHTSFMVWF